MDNIRIHSINIMITIESYCAKVWKDTLKHEFNDYKFSKICYGLKRGHNRFWMVKNGVIYPL